MMDVDSLMSTLKGSDVVVCHGGPGSIMEARATGHVPIVVPRERQFGEHVDDHQVRFSTRLARDGMVVLARDEAAFRSAVTAQLERDSSDGLLSSDSVVEAAISTFAQLVDELVASGPGRRHGRVRPT
jgi:UDP-N-acetylglucosamine transferase subunit ALG13